MSAATALWSEPATLVVFGSLHALPLLVFSLLASTALRRAAPSLRHGLLTASLVGVLAMPLLDAMARSARWLPRLPPGSRLGTMPGAELLGGLAGFGRLSPTLVLIVVAGWLVCVARLAFAIRSIARLRRGSTPLEDDRALTLLAGLSDEIGLRRPPCLLVSVRPIVPLTWSLWRPKILVPRAFLTWPEGRQRAVLLHELEHVRRRDALTVWTVELTCALHWFNPLIWAAASRIRLYSEQACDLAVVHTGVAPVDLAADLAAVARFASAAPSPPPAASAVTRRLESRVEAILAATGIDQTSRLQRAATVVAVVLVPLLSATLWPNVPPRDSGSPSGRMARSATHERQVSVTRREERTRTLVRTVTSQHAVTSPARRGASELVSEAP